MLKFWDNNLKFLIMDGKKIQSFDFFIHLHNTMSLLESSALIAKLSYLFLRI